MRLQDVNLARDVYATRVQKYLRHVTYATLHYMYGDTPYYGYIAVEAEKILVDNLPLIRGWHSPASLFGGKRNRIRWTAAKVIMQARVAALETAKPAGYTDYLKPIPFA